MRASPIILKSLSNLFYIDVRELDLADSKSGLKAFEETIKMNSLFKHIIINQYDFIRLIYEGRTKTIDDELQKEIYKKIEKQDGFNKFIFDHVPIGKNLVRILSKSIMNKMQLEFFSIMKSNIDQDQMPVLLGSLKTCERLKFLNLSEINLKNSVAYLNNTLQALSFIEVLALNNCQIGVEGLYLGIFLTLSTKRNLKDLYLSGNEIGDNGVANLKYYFNSKFTELRALSLSNNNITETGAEYLSDFLESKSQLHYLRIGHNKIKAKGINCIITALKNNSNFNDLDVGSNEIGDEGCKHLEKYLHENKKISYLNVMKNEISEERIVSILNKLKKQSTPCNINVFGNKAKDDNIQKFFTNPPSNSAGGKK